MMQLLLSAPAQRQRLLLLLAVVLITGPPQPKLLLVSAWGNDNNTPSDSGMFVQVGDASSTNAECDLACMNDAPCLFGRNDVSDHAMYDPDGNTSYQSPMGMHCACPHGWTGQLCNVPFETCSGSHKCYHGGQCVPGASDVYGNEQLRCDCYNAMDPATGDPYVGDFCEHRASNFCDGSNKEHFCIFGGICDGKFPFESSTPCQCPPGRTGEHCEYAGGDGGQLQQQAPPPPQGQYEYQGSVSQQQQGPPPPMDEYDGPPPPYDGPPPNDYYGPPSGGSGECDKNCLNGGNCVMLGSPEAEDQWDIDNEQRHDYYWMDNGYDPDPDDNTSHMRCNCPPGYDGEYCQVPRTPCGHRFCFFGGTCLQKPLEDGIEYFCNCATAHTAEGYHYAGQFCQYPSTSYCDSEDSLEQNPSNMLNGDLFCVNGGQCRQPNESHLGCDCSGTGGYSGFSCEFWTPSNDEQQEEGPPPSYYAESPDYDEQDSINNEWTSPSDPTVGNAYNAPPEEIDYNNVGVVIHQENPSDVACNLRCFNGGSCRWGEKNSGGTWQSTVDNSASLDSRTYDPDTYQHCVCPAGYNGLYCEYEVETCPGGQHLCMHGGRCVPDGNGCDCSDANGNQDGFNAGKVYVGDSCEHSATDICTVTQPGPGKPLSFCVNNGTCKRQITSEEPHPGCNCPAGWKGPHCELQSKNYSYWENRKGNSAAENLGIAIAIIGALIGALLAFGFLRKCWRSRVAARNAAEEKDGLKWATSAYHDEPPVLSSSSAAASLPTSLVNLAPRRRSSIMEDVNDFSSKAASRGSALAKNARPQKNRPDSAAEDDSPPEVYMGPPMDEDGHELHQVKII